MGRAICTFLISTIIGVGLSFFNPVWGVTAAACIVGSAIIYSIQEKKNGEIAVSTFIISIIIGCGVNFFMPGLGLTTTMCIMGAVIVYCIEKKKDNENQEHLK